MSLMQFIPSMSRPQIYIEHQDDLLPNIKGQALKGRQACKIVNDAEVPDITDKHVGTQYH